MKNSRDCRQEGSVMPIVTRLVLFLTLVTTASLAQNAVTNTAVLPVPKLENDFYDWYQRHEQVKELIKRQPADLVFIGDSITHMFGGLPPSPVHRGKDVWERYYGKRRAVNLGFGWDRTQNVLWRLEHGEFEGLTPKVVVLLIGTNNRTGTKNARENSPAEIAEGIEAICKRIHAQSAATRIVLLSVLPRSPALFIAPLREINRRIVTLESLGYVTFLDLWPVFADADGLPRKELMADTVHPNAHGYEVWAKALEPLLVKLLEEP
jgi:lysophospholipase L1-like esterase